MAGHRADPRTPGAPARAWTPDRRPLPPGTTFAVAAARPAPGVVVLGLGGDLDLATTAELDERVAHELTGHQVRELVVDLTALRFLGVAGIHSLLRVRDRTAAEGIGLQLVLDQPVFHRLLDVLALSGRFRIRPDLATALLAAGWGDR